jgi:arylsulfatase A-like enzyme
VFSGQPEDFHHIAEETGMDRADVRWDASRFPPGERMYHGSTANQLMIPGRLVAARFAEWVASLPRDQRFFAYVNIQEMHFPYNSEKIPCSLVKEPVLRGEITPGNRNRVLRTYYNAAHEADAALKQVLDALRERDRYDSTLVVVVGDHGEELLDDGYIGHGVNISHEQNETIGKVLNSDARFPESPIAISDVGRVIHNGLVRAEAGRMPFAGTVLTMLGGPNSPREIGLFDAGGVRKYDFLEGTWLRQRGPGAPFAPIAQDHAVIHAWESYAMRAAAVILYRHEE